METRAEASSAAPDRLDSWKEIAVYLKRDVRTLQRWEKEEGLPVHRLQHGKQGSVYAHRRELDDWWESRRRDLDRSAPAPVTRRWLAVLLLVSVAGLTVAGLLWLTLARRAASDRTTDRSFFQFPVVLADDGVGVGLSMSPDGRELAFNTCCTDRRIWRHTFASAKNGRDSRHGERHRVVLVA